MSRLLAEADLLGAGIITWRRDGTHDVFCFCSGAGVPHTARSTSWRGALSELVRFLRKVKG